MQYSQIGQFCYLHAGLNKLNHLLIESGGIIYMEDMVSPTNHTVLQVDSLIIRTNGFIIGTGKGLRET